MTELEVQLSRSLSKLSTQYEADMTRLAEQNLHLQTQVQTLAQQVQTLAQQVSSLGPRFDVQTQQVETLTNAYNKLATTWLGEFK